MPTKWTKRAAAVIPHTPSNSTWSDRPEEIERGTDYNKWGVLCTDGTREPLSISGTGPVHPVSTLGALLSLPVSPCVIAARDHTAISIAYYLCNGSLVWADIAPLRDPKEVVDYLHFYLHNLAEDHSPPDEQNLATLRALCRELPLEILRSSLEHCRTHAKAPSPNGVVTRMLAEELIRSAAKTHRLQR